MDEFDPFVGGGNPVEFDPFAGGGTPVESSSSNTYKFRVEVDVKNPNLFSDKGGINDQPKPLHDAITDKTYVANEPFVIEVDAVSKQDAMDKVKAMGYEGTIKATKIIPSSVPYLNMDTAERGQALTTAGIETGLNPIGMAEVFPYATSQYLASESVSEKPSWLSMAKAGVRDVYSLPGRALTSEIYKFGNDNLGKTSEQYGSEGLGGFIPSVVTDPSNVPMLLTGGTGTALKTGGMLNKALNPIRSTINKVPEMMTTLSTIGKRASSGVVRHGLPNALTGGVYSTTGAGFNTLTKEDQKTIDNVVQVIGGSIASGVIGGAGSKLSENVFNAISKNYPSFNKNQVEYIMGRLGLTAGGTKSNLEKDIPERIGDIALIQVDDTGRKFVPSTSANDIKNKIIDSYRTSIKNDRQFGTMNPEVYKKKTALIEEFNKDISEIDIRGGVSYLDRLLDEAKYYYTKDPVLGNIILKEIQKTRNSTIDLLNAINKNTGGKSIAPSDITSQFDKVSAAGTYLNKPITSVGGDVDIAKNLGLGFLKNLGNVESMNTLAKKTNNLGYIAPFIAKPYSTLDTLGR